MTAASAGLLCLKMKLGFVMNAMSNMKWKNLNDYTCPKDGSVLFSDPIMSLHKCSECDFIISYVKFDKIVKGEKNFVEPYKEPDRTGWE